MLASFSIGIYSAWMERLFTDNWTVEPINIQLPDDSSVVAIIQSGQLAQSWEFTDPTTFVIHLRQDVYWQNIPPANGRQFVASDVVAHYMRMYDSEKWCLYDLGGAACHKPIPNLTSVTATGNYTVTFKWNTPNPEIML